MLNNRILCFPLFLLTVATRLTPCFASKNIPGATQTENGYDTEMGTDAICWKSQSASEGLPMPNPLIKDYMVSIEGVKLLRACPIGNNISGTAPREAVEFGERLRTQVEYVYSVSVDINMTSLQASAGFVSDRGPGFIAVQVLNCIPYLSGFCSPFIHEEANARLAAAAATAKVAAATNPNAATKTTSNASAAPAPASGRGALHGGTHVHSEYVYVNLPPEEGPVYKNVQVNIPMVVQTPGNYFSVAAVQLYFWDNSDDFSGNLTLYRMDMSNALAGIQRLVTYQAPAKILEVDDGATYFVFALIGVSSLAIMFLLYETIKHRNHQVMKLSQVNFLIVFLVAALIATAASFLVEPKNDFYCRSSVPISLICLQVLYAVTAGRLWRIYTLINPLLLKTMGQHKGWWSRFVSFVQNHVCARIRRRANNGNRALRSQVTETQLLTLVAVLVTPQAIVQLLGLHMQQWSRSVDFNGDESTGRAVCDFEGHNEATKTIVYYGYFLFCLLVVGLLGMAIQSRKLPSLFNESKTIFDSTLTSLIIMVMGIAVIIVTQDPTTPPTVAYLVKVFIILSMTVNMSIRIVMPKLRMIWRGETVVVSQLVMDHTKKVRKTMRGTENISCSESRGVLYNEDGLFQNSAVATKSQAREVLSSNSGYLDSASVIEIQTEPARNAMPETEPGTGATVPSKPKKSVVLVEAADRYAGSDGSGSKAKKNKREMLVQANEAPSRRLVLIMVDMQEHLNKVTQKIMSGMAVPTSEWETTRGMASKFGKTFSEDVKFAWHVENVDKEPVQPHTEELSHEIIEEEAALIKDEREPSFRRQVPSTASPRFALVMELQHPVQETLQNAVLRESQLEHDPDHLRGEFIDV